MSEANGHVPSLMQPFPAPDVPAATFTKQVRVVPTIQIRVHPGEPVILMTLGTETSPELATMMTPDIARKVAKALLEHADRIDGGRGPARIITPGDAGYRLPPQGGTHGG